MIRTLILLVFAWSLSTPMFSQDCTPRLSLINGLATNLIAVDTDGDMLTDVWGAEVNVTDFILSASSPCGNELTYGIAKESDYSDEFPETTRLFFCCSETGPQPVVIYVRDEFGNRASALTYVIIQANLINCDDPQPPLLIKYCDDDEVAPQLKVVAGLVGNLVLSPSGSPKAKISAGALLTGKSDNCSELLRLKISRARDFDGTPPTTSYIEFGCEDLGLSPVMLWARDLSGNWSYVETYLIIQDLDGVCGTQEVSTCTPDNTAPAGLVLNGIAKPLSPDNTVTLYAQEYVWRSSDNCSAISATCISTEDLQDPPVGQQSTVLESAWGGTFPVYIWISDEAGNWSKTVSYLLLNEPDELLDPTFSTRDFLNEWWDGIRGK